MTLRVSPVWWPLLAVASPALAPMMALRHRTFRANRDRASEVNEQRIARADKLAIPAVQSLNLQVVVEERAAPGFSREAGVSYLLTTELGSLLFDVGFGPQKKTLGDNATQLGIRLETIDALAISHLHPDHMGGLQAKREGTVRISRELGSPRGQPCYLPGQAEAPGFEARVVDGACMLEAGVASTGPLARSLFFMGWTEEQALLVNVKDRGLVVITGCGHQTMPVLMRLVRALSDEPIYAFVGGVHMPVTQGRGSYAGIQVQCLLGTGKPPWERITDDDVLEAVEAFRQAGVSRVSLSAHDSCDHALDEFASALDADVEVLEAGRTYRFAS